MRFTEHNNKLIPEPLAPHDALSAKPISRLQTVQTPSVNPDFHYSKELQATLQGKQLLLDELPFPIEQIHSHYEKGYITYRKGIIIEKGHCKCERCGNENETFFAAFSCARCHTECTYCRKCIMLGRVSTCTPLISWTGPANSNDLPEKILHWDGTLSKGQQRASDAVVQTINENSDLLVWAVCGSGKTEVLFAGIKVALEAKKRICIATPRTDVVFELVPRLHQAFPPVDVIALYGGSPDRHKFGPLLISTTHQLLRYYQAFDVIIIDEVDAFPYSVEPMLQYAVNQSKKIKSTTIYLTATPNKKWQRQVRIGRQNAVIIPARFHRHPLPVPTFEWCGNWRKLQLKSRIPKNIYRWIQSRIDANKQAFLFVPQVDALHEIVTILKKENSRIEGVHAQDQDRQQKVNAFRTGEITILVTTTILERGVTVPNIDVAVLGAEDKVFTESALVQIAGRVGRSAEHPTGEIVFFHYGKTTEMVAAKKQIEKMNRDGKEQGLLEVGDKI